MSITALQGPGPELEKAFQLAFEPVVTELRNALFQKMLALAPVTEPADESFRLRADALVEALLADLDTALPRVVIKGLFETAARKGESQQAALVEVLRSVLPRHS